MNAGPDVERLITGWLHNEAPKRAPDRILVDARTVIDRTRQRRFVAGWREPMFSMRGLAATAVVVAVAVGIGGSLYFLGRSGLGFGSSSSPSPSMPSMSPTPRPTPTPVPGSVSPITGLIVVARDVAFDRFTLQAAGRQPFTITLRNEDPPDLIHDIDIRTTDGTVVSDQETIVGGTERVYQIEALPPGTYEFICSIHPIVGMTGTLTVR
jgi:hypothetical protein